MGSGGACAGGKRVRDAKMSELTPNNALQRTALSRRR